MEVILSFYFVKLIDEIEIKNQLRVSMLLKENDNYLMPCEFIEVSMVGDDCIVKVKALDPDKFLSKKMAEKEFLFGHPGKIIGSGIMK